LRTGAHLVGMEGIGECLKSFRIGTLHEGPYSSRCAAFLRRHRQRRQERTAPPSSEAPLFSTLRANRIALTAQLLFGLSLFLANAHTSYSFAKQFGFARPKSPLYGIWDVEQQLIDGQLRSPLLDDSGRWRASFSTSLRASFQHMDDSFARYGSKAVPRLRP
jgi:hypothetical protein